MAIDVDNTMLGGEPYLGATGGDITWVPYGKANRRQLQSIPLAVSESDHTRKTSHVFEFIILMEASTH